MREAPGVRCAEGFTSLHRYKETMMVEPNVNRLDELFEYFEGGMGALVWRSGRHKGEIAGTENACQDIRIRVDGQSLSAAKIVWAIHTGVWPECRLRHKNQDRTDIRYQNLALTARREGPGR